MYSAAGILNRQKIPLLSSNLIQGTQYVMQNYLHSCTLTSSVPTKCNQDNGPISHQSLYIAIFEGVHSPAVADTS